MWSCDQFATGQVGRWCRAHLHVMFKYLAETAGAVSARTKKIMAPPDLETPGRPPTSES